MRGVIASDRRQLAVVIGLYAGATAAGLVAPRMLGDIVTGVQHGATAGRIDVLTVIIAISLLVQSGLIRFGALAGARFGEGLLARLREDFVERVLGAAAVGGRARGQRRPAEPVLPRRRVAEPGRQVRAAGHADRRAGRDPDAGRDRARLPWLLLPCVLVVIPVWLSARGGTCAGRPTRTCARARRGRS